MPGMQVPSFVHYQAWPGTRALYELFATLISHLAWRALWYPPCNAGQDLASPSMPGSVCTPWLQGLPQPPLGHSRESNCTGE